MVFIIYINDYFLLPYFGWAQRPEHAKRIFAFFGTTVFANGLVVPLFLFRLFFIWLNCHDSADLDCLADDQEISNYQSGGGKAAVSLFFVAVICHIPERRGCLFKRKSAEFVKLYWTSRKHCIILGR